jgi:hypothetical protein
LLARRVLPERAVKEVSMVVDLLHRRWYLAYKLSSALSAYTEGRSDTLEARRGIFVESVIPEEVLS